MTINTCCCSSSSVEGVIILITASSLIFFVLYTLQYIIPCIYYYWWHSHWSNISLSWLLVGELCRRTVNELMTLDSMESSDVTCNQLETLFVVNVASPGDWQFEFIILSILISRECLIAVYMLYYLLLIFCHYRNIFWFGHNVIYLCTHTRTAVYLQFSCSLSVCLWDDGTTNRGGTGSEVHHRPSTTGVELKRLTPDLE